MSLCSLTSFSSHEKRYQNVKIFLSGPFVVAILQCTLKWEVTGDLNMVAFLVGLQDGFTKFQSCLCLLGSRYTALHYKKSSWPPRTSYEMEVTT